MNIGVVVFSKNEARNIGEVLDDILQYIRREKVSVIDAASTDGTFEIVRSKGISLYTDPGTGKGGGIRWAIQQLSHDYLILMDSDCSHQAKEIPHFINELEKDGAVDMIVGSRFLGGSEELGGNIVDLTRRVGNRLSVGVINVRWGAKCTDVQNGFRAIRVQTMRDLNLTEDSFAIEQEMVMKCLINNKKIREIPSFELKRKHGTPHLKAHSMLAKFIKSLFLHIVFSHKYRQF